MEKRDFVIVVDSCSDLNKELRTKNGIEYVKMSFVKKFADHDEEVPASLDWDLFTNKELNDWQRNGMQLKTIQVTAEEFTNKFTEILNQNKDVLYIACSSALSGSYDYSLIVKDELLTKYPNAKIICVDSLCSCLGQGSMALDVAKMQKEGATIEQCRDYLEENKLCYNQLATVETLDYLKKAGRIKASTAFFGNIFGVKPIFISDAIGQNFAVKKVKGRKNSFIEMVNMMKELIVEPEKQTVYVCHSDCLEDAQYVKELIEKEIKPLNVSIEYLGPIIGVSTGPGTIGIYFKGQKVTVTGK